MARIEPTPQEKFLRGILSRGESKRAIPPKSSGWQSVTFGTGWSNYGGYALAGCIKLPGGLVVVKGLVKKSTAASSGEVVVTLPVGYRPAETSIFLAKIDMGYQRVDVHADGAVSWIADGGAGNPNVYLSLNGIHFMAA